MRSTSSLSGNQDVESLSTGAAIPAQDDNQIAIENDSKRHLEKMHAILQYGISEYEIATQASVVLMWYLLSELNILNIEREEPDHLKVSEACKTYVTNAINGIESHAKSNLLGSSSKHNFYNNITTLIMEGLFSSLPLLKPDEVKWIIENLDKSLDQILLATKDNTIIKCIINLLRPEFALIKENYNELYVEIDRCLNDQVTFEFQSLVNHKAQILHCMKGIPGIYIQLKELCHNAIKKIDPLIDQLIVIEASIEKLIQISKTSVNKFDRKKIVNNVFPADVDLISSQMAVHAGTLKYLDNLVDVIFNKNLKFPLQVNKTHQSFSHNIAHIFREAAQPAEQLISLHADKVFHYCVALKSLVEENDYESILTKDCYQSAMFAVMNVMLKACRSLMKKAKELPESCPFSSDDFINLCAGYLETAELDKNANMLAQRETIVKVVKAQVKYFYQAGCTEKTDASSAKNCLNRGLVLLPKNKELTKLKNSLEIEVQYFELKSAVGSVLTAHQEQSVVFTKEQINISISESTGLPKNTSRNSHLIEEHNKLVLKRQELEKLRTTLEKDKAIVLDFTNKHTQLLAECSHLFEMEKLKPLTTIDNASIKSIKDIQVKARSLNPFKDKIISGIKNFQILNKKYKQLQSEFLLMASAFNDALAKENKNAQAPKKPKTVKAGKKQKNNAGCNATKQKESQTQLAQDNKPVLAESMVEAIPEKFEPEKIEKPTAEGSAAQNAEPATEDLPTETLETIKRKRERNAKKREKRAQKKELVENQKNQETPPAVETQNLESLDKFTFLHKLDDELRAVGSKLIFKGSITSQWGIFCFNKNPALAKYFPVNDIDLQIEFDPKVKKEIIDEILVRFGFILNHAKENFYYSQYTNSKHDSLDLTRIINKEYRSYGFIPLCGAKAEFFDSSQILDSNNSINEELFKMNGHEFKLHLPLNQESDFISACRFETFSFCKPNENFKSFLYNIYRYAEKLSYCGVDPYSLNISASISPELMPCCSLLKLENELVKYFDNHLGDFLLYELKDFIHKGVRPDTEWIAVPLITALYTSFLKKVYFNGEAFQWVDQHAKTCAQTFIRSYCLNSGKKSQQGLQKVDLQAINEKFSSIAALVVSTICPQQVYIPYQQPYYYPMQQQTFFPQYRAPQLPGTPNPTRAPRNDKPLGPSNK